MCSFLDKAELVLVVANKSVSVKKRIETSEVANVQNAQKNLRCFNERHDGYFCGRKLLLFFDRFLNWLNLKFELFFNKLSFLSDDLIWLDFILTVVAFRA